MLRGSLCAVAAVAALFFSAVPAWAGASGARIAAKNPDFGPPVTSRVLDKQRAGAELRINLNDVKAQLNNNQAINTLNGSNYISSGAFSQASGLPVAVQNSGNNVVIQNSFILNMNVQ